MEQKIKKSERKSCIASWEALKESCCKIICFYGQFLCAREFYVFHCATRQIKRGTEQPGGRAKCKCWRKCLSRVRRIFSTFTQSAFLFFLQKNNVENKSCKQNHI